jgi:hypothetical protein
VFTPLRHAWDEASYATNIVQNRRKIKSQLLHSLQYLLHLIHNPVHLGHRQVERTGRRQIHACLFQEVDGIPVFETAFLVASQIT